MCTSVRECPIVCVCVPESEGGSAGEEDGLGFGLGLLEEPEEGVVLHTHLPEHLAAVPARHGELQRVVVVALLLGDKGAPEGGGGGYRRRLGGDEVGEGQRDGEMEGGRRRDEGEREGREWEGVMKGGEEDREMRDGGRRRDGGRGMEGGEEERGMERWRGERREQGGKGKE